jgi:hypothetical protein
MRIYIWMAIVVAAITYTAIAYLTVDRTGDEPQIRAMISDTVAAIEKRDLGGTIACVSKDYKDAELNYDRLRVLVAQALRVEKDYTAKAEVNSIKIDGNKATVDLVFNVNALKGGSSMYARNLTLHLAKENGRHALIVPVKVWRVTSVDGLALQVEGGY